MPIYTSFMLSDDATQFKWSLEIDIDDLIESALVGILYRAKHRIGGGIVDDYVEASIGFDGFIHERMDIVQLTHIGCDAGCFQSIGPKTFGHGIDGFLFSAADYDFGAKFGQATGHRFTDPLARAGHQGDLPVQLE